MEITVHKDALEPLLPEWGKLFSLDPSATPFSSPEWAHAWWFHWAGSASPWIVVVRDNGELIGLAAFMQRRQGGFRVLREIGRGPGDYWDILAVPERRSDVAVAIADEILRRRSEWDALILDGLHTTALSAALTQGEVRVQAREPLVSVEMALPDTFEEYLTTLPSRRRSNLRRHLRRLDEGDFAFSTIDRTQVPESIERWHDLRLRWWAERGLNLAAMHRTGRFRDFTRDAVIALKPAGLVEACELRYRDEPVGVCINLVNARTFYVYLAAFDPKIAKLGPGKIQIGEAIRSSIDSGRRCFDFTIGRDPYKYWFGGTDVERLRQVLGTRSLRSQAAVFASGIRERRRSDDNG